jgi:NAD+ diphosphatase
MHLLGHRRKGWAWRSTAWRTPRLRTTGRQVGATTPTGSPANSPALGGTAPVFAADLSGLEEAALRLSAAEASVDLRSLAAVLPRPLAATLAYARGLLCWNRRTRFCGSCGSSTRSAPAGHVRVCTGPDCGRQLFPRIEPAVIALVESPDPRPRCLPARHHGAGPDGFSLHPA